MTSSCSFRDSLRSAGSRSAVVDEETPDAEQVHESLKGDRLLTPETGVPARETRHAADRGVDKHPVLAIGNESQPHVTCAAQFDHAFYRRRSPFAALDRCTQLRVGCIDRDEHERPDIVLRIDDSEVRPQRGIVFRERGRKGLGQFALRLENVSLVFFIQFENLLEDEVDPGFMDRGELGVIGVDRLSPLVIGLTHMLALQRVGLFQPLRKHPLQYRLGQEGTGYVDQGKPFTMSAELRHAFVLPAMDSGTRNTTATGKVRATKSR